MRITIEKVENGFLVVYETEKGRRVVIFTTAGETVAFVKSVVDPSPILTGAGVSTPLALV